ncbi:hypothetical protein SO802_016847 [Lithocarpus litseifolius]|uniref:Reverse transcriptase zinc-binding domain-containing protein n=1 Tax=Lithocarpus litseifolius TaxID=425828 RepID=A0AAW2D319_9ROSI
MWKACRDKLPTNHRLKIRKVLTKDSCPFCGRCESSGHILWDCKLASEVWFESNLSFPNLPIPQREFIDIVWFLRETQKVVDWDLFAITAWSLWNNRNAMKHEGRCKSAKQIV